MSNVILVDLQNILMIHGHFCREEILNGDRTKLLSTLMKVVTDIQSKLQIRNVLFAREGSTKENWRHEYWPLYKQNRIDRKKKYTEEDKIYHDRMFSIGNQFIDEYLDKPNWNSLGFINTEADDIINVVAICNSKQGYKSKIVSVDVDFMMLLDLPDVEIYDPRKNKFKSFPYKYPSSGIVVYSPKILTEMCVCNGQTKDNIWNAKSTEEKKARFGEKTCFKMLCDEIKRDEFYSEYSDNIKRNNAILNPFSTPDHIVKQVMNGYNELKWSVDSETGGSLFDRMKRGEI